MTHRHKRALAVGLGGVWHRAWGLAPEMGTVRSQPCRIEVTWHLLKSLSLSVGCVLATFLHMCPPCMGVSLNPHSPY